MIEFLKKIGDKFGSFGSVLAAAACPACFPALAGLASALGLSFLAPYERYMLILFQILVLVSLASVYYGYRNHKKKVVLIMAGISVLVIMSSFYVIISINYFWVIYVGFALLIVSSLLNTYYGRCNKVCCKN